MQDIRAVMRSLPLVASILGRRYGVRVRIGGKDAYTDGKTIQLPSLPTEDASLLPLVRGYLDHEAGHVRETDFEALRQAQLSPIEKHITNILEDWRVENKLAAVFPGCRANFDWLIEHFFGGDMQAKPTDDATTILHWLLLVVRSWDVPSVAAQRDALATIVDSGFPGVRQRVEPILARAYANCGSTPAAIVYAQEIVHALRLWMDACSSQGTHPRNSHATQAQRAANAEATPDNGDADQIRVEAVQGMLEASAEALPSAMGTLLAEAIQHCATEGNTLSVATEQPRRASPLTPEAMVQARTASVSIRTRLHGLIQTKILTRDITGRSGKLDTRRLHRIVSSDARLFRSRTERQGISTAVHILLDCSGSMTAHMRLACTACYATATALEAVGTNVALTAFPGHYIQEQDSWATVSPLIRHGQRVHQQVDLGAGGGTPFAETLWWAMQVMLPLRERRKIILVITDGEPDSGELAEDALNVAGRSGFEVYGIGIHSQSVSRLMPHRHGIIYSIDDLPAAMFRMLQTALAAR